MGVGDEIKCVEGLEGLDLEGGVSVGFVFLYYGCVEFKVGKCFFLLLFGVYCGNNI